MADITPGWGTPTRTRRLEVRPLAGGGAEIVVARTRTLRLTADALWLLERIDGHRSVEDLARELAGRFSRAVSPADAGELIRGSLVAQGLVEFPGPERPPGASPPLLRAHRVVLLRASTVRAWCGALAWLAAPPVAAGLLAAALLAIGLAGARIAATGAAAWTDPRAWALAAGSALASLLAHEMGHAFALFRAGGTPGEVAVVIARGRPRMGTDLAGLETLSPLARAGVDLAGVAAQVVFAGSLAGIALARPYPCAPALSLLLLLVLGDLLPLPGTDGRWLLDDLARHDPADALRRRVTPWRWLVCVFERLRARALLASGRGAHQELARLFPVFVSASFPEWSARRLRRHAARHLEMLAVVNHDQHALLSGSTCDDIRHVRPVRALMREGRGAVVCGMHVGPYMYVSDALMRLGCRVLTYAAPNQQRNWGTTWIESARRRGAAFELLTPRSTRDAVRAVRAVRDGGFLHLLMDGQNAMTRDQHRADFRFLGTELYMRTGPALLALHARSPILLAASWYEGAARRVVEFSDPLPPPEDGSAEALVARTGEMYAWFEQRVARVPHQWDGWVWPLMHWRATGGPPTATATEIGQATQRAREALTGPLRLRAEPTRVNTIELNGEHLIVHGPEHRVLLGDALTVRVLHAAFRHTRVRDLPARAGATPEALAAVIARLTLAGLATLGD
jgi:lauroyl/myristoyl acyltransferase